MIPVIKTLMLVKNAEFDGLILFDQVLDIISTMGLKPNIRKLAGDGIQSKSRYW